MLRLVTTLSLVLWINAGWLLAQSQPNIVLFFADDLGYGDLGCFGGNPAITPNLDRMAQEGMRLTSFYASQAVCSASRSSLLTGCYNVRIGILGALGPGSKVCLNSEETTVAEMLKAAGYKTAIFGKWHLGDRASGLPIHHGFDRYHGLPYSNDMWPSHPTAKNFPALPMYENEQIIRSNVTAQDQQFLTQWATDQAVAFIQENKDGPFFVYMPYSMPHVPIFASQDFNGKTGQGLYADVIAELDWSVGQVLSTLQAEGLDSNTLVFFTSDNGPWLSYGNHAGSAGFLREGKGTTWEGGMRVPAIVRWPNKIPAGASSDLMAGTIDVLPTLADFCQADLPQQKIDGKSLRDLLTGVNDKQSPHEAYFYYWNKELQAVRNDRWKLHFPHSYRSLKGKPGQDGLPAPYVEKKCGLELYDLKADPGEAKDLAEQNPDVVDELQRLAEHMRQQLGDSLTGISGTENRPAGSILQE